jgi:hypothetical protein
MHLKDTGTSMSTGDNAQHHISKGNSKSATRCHHTPIRRFKSMKCHCTPTRKFFKSTRCHRTPIKMAKIQPLQTSNAGAEDIQQKSRWLLVQWMKVQRLGDDSSLFATPNVSLPCDRAITFLGTHPNEQKAFSHTKASTQMLIASYRIITKTWKQLRCLSIVGWVNKLWYIPTLQCDTVMTRNGPLSHRKTGRKLNTHC